MSSNDLVRFITEQVLTHFKRSKTERKELRKQRKIERSPMSSRWFGLLPYAMRFFMKNLLKR